MTFSFEILVKPIVLSTKVRVLCGLTNVNIRYPDKYNYTTPLEDDFLSWLKIIYKNYKINYKIYKYFIKKFSIIL